MRLLKKHELDSPALAAKGLGGVDPAELVFFADLQALMAPRRRALPKSNTGVCAIDAAYRGDDVVAVASVFRHELLAEKSVCAGHCTFPYVSGLFYLREGPFAVEAVRRLRTRPWLLCFDAHGVAHPRSAGLATICGAVLGTPSIGMAKSLLVGKVAPGEGSLERITYGGRTVGFVTRTGGVARYWSPGYSVSLGELKSIIRRHAPTCLKAMAESDRTARGRLRPT